MKDIPLNRCTILVLILSQNSLRYIHTCHRPPTRGNIGPGEGRGEETNRIVLEDDVFSLEPSTSAHRCHICVELRR